MATKAIGDLDAGTNKLSGCAGKVIREERPYVKLLTDPVYNQTDSRWEVLAQVENSLAIIEVSLKVNQ